MKIVGKVESEGYLTYRDLDPGTCFHFKNDDTLFIACTGNCLANLENGDLFNIFEQEWSEKPVMRKNAFVRLEN